MDDNELVKALQGDAKWVKRISWQNAPTGGSAEFLKVSGRIVEAAARIEQLARENASLQEAVDEFVYQWENGYLESNSTAATETLRRLKKQPPEKG